MNQLYSQERKDAIKASRKRDKLFLQASRAFDDGDHATAKNYAEQGHQCNVLSHQLHRQACDRIFTARNLHLDLNKMDLHGLYAPEAIEKVSERLVLLGSVLEEDSTCGFQHLEVITGFGKHQKASPILRPAIQEYLEKEGFSFRESFPGKFVVVLQKYHKKEN